MKFNQFRLLFFLSAIIIYSSCLTTNTPTTVSSDASFVSLTLAGNDSVKKAVFTINGNTIVNIDSLPFHSKIDSVYPTFSFKSTGGAFLHINTSGLYKFTKGKKDSIVVTGKDTIDFTQPGLSVSNYAADAKTYLKYTIQINVHKVQPELYVWGKVKDNLSSMNATSQKAVVFKDMIYYFLNDGISAELHTSTDGLSWNSGNSVSGLPISTPLNDMIQFNGKLFTARDGSTIYSSIDGTVWKAKSVPDFTFKSLLFSLNGQLWATVQSISDNSYHFATSIDGDVWAMLTDVIPATFPVSDFASVTFSTVTGKSKVIVLGGYSQTGTLLKNCWSTEGEKENGLYYWVNFSNENNSLDSLAAGASVISYDNKLLLLGKNNIYNTVFYRESIDEGFSWKVPNKIYNQIAIANQTISTKTRKDTITYSGYYQPHIHQSVVVDKNCKIFIIGGYVDNSITSNAVRRYNVGKISSGNVNLTPVSDIWAGKLNRKSFLRQ
jgi:hypothetical protein